MAVSLIMAVICIYLMISDVGALMGDFVSMIAIIQ